MTQLTAPIIFDELITQDGYTIGRITLASPKSLNALAISMIGPMTDQLLLWANNPEIMAIWLEGEGEKAFCAGGDIIDLYHSMKAAPRGPNPYALDFFSREYQLDYLIHTYPKPILCWGTGIVMGGGMGLMQGCSHRIVTETTRMAMPEISIGLFPDVGGTWFLNHMPGKTGLYLGLTGSSINASDALYTRLADHFVPADQKQELLDALLKHPWTGKPDVDKANVATLLLSRFEQPGSNRRPAPQVEAHIELINRLVSADNLIETTRAIRELQTEDPWLKKGQRNFLGGCPTSIWLVYEQLHRGRRFRLSEVFHAELNMAMSCVVHGNFQEGVRALLIDKDNAPRWQHDSVEAVPKQWIDAHFSYPWPEGASPLKSMGKPSHPLH